MAEIQQLLRTAAGNQQASFGVDEVWQRTRTIRRRRIISFATIGSVAVVALFWIAGTQLELFGSNPSEPATPAPPQRTEVRHREPRTNVRIAKAPDGSWAMFAGVDKASESLCLSLEGMSCTTTSLRSGFVLMSSFAWPEQEGFIYGTVHADVDTLQLVTDDSVVPVSLRLRSFPKRLGLDQLRFFLRPLRGVGGGTVVARGRDGNVLQETDFVWGES